MVPSRCDHKAKVIWKYGLLAVGVIILAFPTMDLIHNQVRLSAFRHIRGKGPRARLETWSIKPKAVLQSRHHSETYFGTIEHRLPFISEIIGPVRVEMLVARLAGPNANDADLEALSHFDELEYLELVDTKITEPALKRIRDALPECDIVTIISEPNAPGHAATQRP